MPFCPKCGNQVEENMTFCPRCGAPLKREAPVQAVAPAPAPRRNEKAEKGEKGEKQEKQEPEKGEKHEKGQTGFIGFLIAGLVLILIGVVSYATSMRWISGNMIGPAVLLVIGVAVIVIGIYAATMAKRRSPPTA